MNKAKRMPKISWTESEKPQVLHRAGTKRELVKIIRERQIPFIGLVMRLQQLDNVCVTGKVEAGEAEVG